MHPLIQTVAAVVIPVTTLPSFDLIIAPAPIKPIPETTPDAIREISTFAPTATAVLDMLISKPISCEIIDVIAAPRQTSECVFMPAG